MDPHISPYFSPTPPRKKKIILSCCFIFILSLKIRVLVSRISPTVISTQDDSRFLHGNVLKLVSNVQICSFQHENALKLVWTIPRSAGTGTESVPVLIKLKVIRTRSRTRTNFFCPFCSVHVTSSPDLKSTRTPSIFPYPQGKGTRTRSRTRTENVGISYVPVSVPIPVLFQYTFRTSITRKISESKDIVTCAPPSPLFPIRSDNYIKCCT